MKKRIKSITIFVLSCLLTALTVICRPVITQAGTEAEGKIMILFTSDVHCGVDKNFGYVGLQQVRDVLDNKGYTTILVDDGDSIQGDNIGTLTKGSAIIDLMNAMKYDVAIPGNHEFDYGMDVFMDLADKAEFPYISCNFMKKTDLVFPPYVIREANGIKIAFVGVTTPQTISASSIKRFQDEEGNTVYNFCQDKTGEKLYQAVQEAVDAARAEGADYVYLLAHLGNEAAASPWTYADVISNTNGIDVVLDGHSHDTDQVVMKNKDGQDVVRSACGTKMSCIGYSCISPEKGIEETNIWTWTNGASAPELLGLQTGVSQIIDEKKAELAQITDQVIGHIDFPLTINDPAVTDSVGQPIRMIRRAETNLGDFVADAFRIQSDADIGISGGGGIRASIEKGDITFGDIIAVLPFGNQICVIEATGQQILDALEFGAREIPVEFGGFLQVSGLTYEVDSTIPSGCRLNDDGRLISIEGPRRVRNVLVAGEPIDPAGTYTVASIDFILLNGGDGLTSFEGAPVVQSMVALDTQILVDYITQTLGGNIGQEYADPYGQGRITILE